MVHFAECKFYDFVDSFHLSQQCLNCQIAFTDIGFCLSMVTDQLLKY